LRHARTKAYHSVTGNWQFVDVSVVVRRALSFFGKSDLRVLRAGDADIFCHIVSMMQPRSRGAAPTSQMAQALDSLRAVEIMSHIEDREKQLQLAAIIERCAATVTELKGPLPARLLCESDRAGHPPVLARCTRLEVLTCADAYPPAAWLGLSQLHTLQGVHLNRVSLAAIAAALPRLHTLTSFGTAAKARSVAGFFTDLLPRLRVFHFKGAWPRTTNTSELASTVAPLPLPLLEELIWQDRSPQSTVHRGFLGARPLLLHAPYELIAEGLPEQGGAVDEGPTSAFSARVRELRLLAGTAPVDLSDLARVLRAALRLRKFHVCHCLRRVVGGDFLWLTAPAAPLDPAFADLVHHQLRDFGVATFSVEAPSQNDACASRLRRACFPRLRVVTLNGIPSFATPEQ
jgi:hypothetical protein